MKKTLANVLVTKRICVINNHVHIKGSVEVFSSGKYFDLCASHDSEEYKTKNALVISVEDVTNIDSGKKLV